TEGDPMTSKVRMFVFVAGLIVTLSVSAFAGKKGSSTKHVAVGTIQSIDSNQMVLNEKVKGKDQPMTFQLNPSTQKSGNLQNGSQVSVQYQTENNQMVATSIRERSTTGTAPNKSSKKTY